MSSPRSPIIVVGAGAAGAPLAARLSEDSDLEVILIEAGATPATTQEFPPELIDASTVRGAVPGHPANWGYLGSLTPDLQYTIARGKILGGSSTINGGYFVRARPEDFDGWAAQDCPEWAYERVLPVLRALEHDLDHGESPVHGGSGPVPVERAPQDNPAAIAFDRAARALGFEPEPDKNAPGVPGVGAVPQNVVGGIRWNTGMTHLNPVRHRRNLTVLGNTRVRRVVFDGTRTVGVEVEASGTVRTISASEVVLCAGAIATPHVLMLSGVGPRDELERHGIDVIADLPGVGEGFSDHPEIQVGWRSRVDIEDPTSPDTFTTALNFTSPTGGRAGDLEILLCVKSMAWLLTGHRHLAAAGAAGAYAAAQHPLSTLASLRGVSLRRLRQQARHARDLALLVSLQAEEARGSIRLASGEPDRRPVIEYRYLSTPGDRERMRIGVRTAVALLRSRAFTELFDRLTELTDAVLDDDTALDDWMLSHLHTAIHMCGTARMGSASDPGAVVDQFGRVRGVTGLRVADTSILPTAPSRGPAATAILIGELVSRFIRRGD